MTLWRNIKRNLCRWMYHDDSGEVLATIGHTVQLKQRTCPRCGEAFWQFGSSGLVQVHDDDPRLEGLLPHVIYVGDPEDIP